MFNLNKMKMKKGLIIIAAVSLLAVVACKKDHTCSCTATWTNSNGTISATTDSTLLDMKKSDAVLKCDEGDYTVSSGDDSVVQECELN